MANNDKETVGVSETPNPTTEKLEVESWLRTIEATERWRDSIGDKAGWKRFIAEYKNDWNHLQAQVSIPIIPINLIFAYVKTEIARLYFRDPWITVNPKRYEDIGAAQIAEQVINYIWKDLKIKDEIKKVLLETLLVGHSWIKVGYVAEFGTVESKPKEEVKRGPGRPPKAKPMEVETNEYIKSESVFAYHVPYDNIIFDPSATYPCTNTARWMAQKIVKPYRAVVESGIYENTDQLKTARFFDDKNALMDNADQVDMVGGKDVKSVVLWEIYDLDHKQIITVSPGCPKKLREVPIPEYLNDSFPFIQFAFNPIPGDVYPLSDIAPHEGQIYELIKMVSIEMNHLKRWNRQMVVDEGTFTKDEEAKFKDANDGAIIHAQGGNAASKIFIPPYAPVQSDIYGVFNQIYQLWQTISGQTSTEQGGQARTQTRTLGELRLALQGSKARPEEKVDVLEDSIEIVAEKLLSIIQKKYDLPKIARLVGPDAIQEKVMKNLPNRPSAQPQLAGGQPNPIAQGSFQSSFGFSWNKTDVVGEMDVDVLAGSTAPMDRESQLEIMERMVPLLAGAGVTPGSPPAKSFLREFMRLIGIVSLETVMEQIDQLGPPPNPEMEKAQADLKSKQMESDIKLKSLAMQEKLKIQGMEQKNELLAQKENIQIQSQIMSSVLNSFRDRDRYIPGEPGE